MEHFKEFKLGEAFERNGFEVFDGILDVRYCSELALRLRASMDKACITVDNDGVHIHTKNGAGLVSELPEIKLIHDFIHSRMSRSIANLMVIEDLPVAISANLLRHEDGHAFRYHFDRHEYTAVLYLTDNKEFPLCAYPNIRTDPLQGGATWLYEQTTRPPVSVSPTPGRLICFKGRTCLHGVMSKPAEAVQKDRLSLQFGYDTRFRRFDNQQYYGRPNADQVATTVQA